MKYIRLLQAIILLILLSHILNKCYGNTGSDCSTYIIDQDEDIPEGANVCCRVTGETKTDSNGAGMAFEKCIVVDLNKKDESLSWYAENKSWQNLNLDDSSCGSVQVIEKSTTKPSNPSNKESNDNSLFLPLISKLLLLALFI